MFLEFFVLRNAFTKRLAVVNFFLVFEHLNDEIVFPCSSTESQ